MTASSPIRIGALACSSYGLRSVFPVIKESPHFQFTHIASRTREKAASVAAAYGAEGLDYEALIACQAVDAVYISVPVGLHYAWARRALLAGKHVLLEKTFTTSLAEARDLIQTAREKGLVLMEAVAYGYHDANRMVWSLLKDGAIGSVRHLEAYFGFPFRPEGDIRHDADLGGGAMLDSLIYPLSFCLYAVGELPSSLSARVERDADRSVDCRGSAQMVWAHATAHLAYGFGFAYRNEYRIWGSNGEISAKRVFSRPPDMACEISITQGNEMRQLPVLPSNQYRLMVEAFAAKIQGRCGDRLNEGGDIEGRMQLIDAFRSAYLGAGEKSVEFSRKAS